MSIVEERDLEATIERLRRSVDDPREGIFGRRSVAWKINKESIVLLGGGSAALLQLAHPYVAHAIDQHSKTREDVAGRFQRTFTNVFAMVFGDLDHAERAARRVHNIHHKIKGDVREDVGAFAKGHQYHANDPDALFWVQATLIHTALQTYELLVGKLTREQKVRYYQESKLFSLLFGIPDSAVPQDYAAFEAYWVRMINSNVIRVGEPAREMAQFLFTPPTRAHVGFSSFLKIMTSGLLPPRIREEYGFPFRKREQVIFRSGTRVLRAVVRATPPRLRYFPAYVEAHRRLQGLPPRDAIGRALERVAVRGLLRPI